MTQNFNGYLLALLAIFLWSFNVIYSKYLAGVFTPFEISFVRWVIPAMLFLPFAYKNIILYRQKILKHWLLILILTLTGLGFQNTFIYYAGYTASAVNMALIGATSPIFLVVFSAMFLHKRITGGQILGVLTAVSGVIVIILNGQLTSLSGMKLSVGDIWMFVAAVAFAVYGVAQKKFPSTLPQFPVFTFMICLSSVIFLPLAAYDFIYHKPVNIHKIDVLILIILGVFNSGIAYIAWNKAIGRIGTVKAGMVYYMIPVFSTIEAYFLLGEKIYAHQIYGMLLVLVGIAISNYHNNKLSFDDISAPLNDKRNVVSVKNNGRQSKRFPL